MGSAHGMHRICTDDDDTITRTKNRRADSCIQETGVENTAAHGSDDDAVLLQDIPPTAPAAYSVVSSMLAGSLHKSRPADKL